MDVESTSQKYEELNIPIGKEKIEICHVNHTFFASKNDAEKLESEARISINRTKTDEKKKKNAFNWEQNSNLCQILPELVAVLVEFGIVDVFRIQMTESGSQKTLIEIHDIPFENTVEFRTKRLTVRDFWRKGFFIADGSRFGGHYLVYTSSPNECHAEFVVLCGPCSDEERVSAMRCCNQVKKTLLLSTTSSDSIRPHFTKCTWFRPEFHGK